MNLNLGAAIGAGAGAAFGHGVGRVIRKGNDKDMAKARLNEKWAPDSSTKTCMGCEKKFTQVKRRHHCRNCGGVFCGKCTKHRMVCKKLYNLFITKLLTLPLF